MARQPDPPNNPFGKLLELGFALPEPGFAESPKKPKKIEDERVERTPTQSRAKTTANKKSNAQPNSRKAKKRQKQEQRKKKGVGAPAFKTKLTAAHNLTAAGTKKPPPYRDGKAGRTKPLKDYAGKSKPTTDSPLLVIRVDPLIAALPQRSMRELQGQWLNCLRLLEDPNKGKRQAARKFRDAILAEWERRCKLALSDPDYFDWPSTQAGPGDRSQRFDTWNQEGVLKYMGYEVGKTKGLADHSRREILDAVFSAVLPPVNSPDYVKKWGLPGTAPRLERLAHELARFARNGKRNRTADYSAAVAHWEADLKHLKRKYYVGKFHFGWPSIV